MAMKNMRCIEKANSNSSGYKCTKMASRRVEGTFVRHRTGDDVVADRQPRIIVCQRGGEGEFDLTVRDGSGAVLGAFVYGNWGHVYGNWRQVFHHHISRKGEVIAKRHLAGLADRNSPERRASERVLQI